MWLTYENELKHLYTKPDKSTSHFVARFLGGEGDLPETVASFPEWVILPEWNVGICGICTWLILLVIPRQIQNVGPGTCDITEGCEVNVNRQVWCRSRWCQKLNWKGWPTSDAGGSVRALLFVDSTTRVTYPCEGLVACSVPGQKPAIVIQCVPVRVKEWCNVLAGQDEGWMYFLRR